MGLKNFFRAKQVTKKHYRKATQQYELRIDDRLIRELMGKCTYRQQSLWFGPREEFVETLRTNAALLRHKIKSPIKTGGIYHG